MAYLSLYRKYRPQTFAEVLGQQHVTRTLAHAVDEGRVSHAYLFTGPRGTGKTSTARILAKSLNCEKGPTSQPCGVCESCVAITAGSSLDVFEMDAASHSGVDDTRDILAGVPLATAGGRRKVYVIDEVHMLTTQSFNALLKTLEEPPEHVVFVLATTEAHKVPGTIISRSQRFDFRRVSVDVLQQHLAHVAKSEQIEAEEPALALIARHADGGVRDSLSTLDQLAGPGDSITLDAAEALLGSRTEDAMFVAFEAIASADIGGVLRAIASLVSQGADLRQSAFDALEHARSLLLLKAAPDADVLVDASEEDRTKLRSQSEAFSGAALLRVLDLLGKAIIEMRNAPNHRLLLEVALVRAASPESDSGGDALLARIERLERRLSIGDAAVPQAPAAPAASAPSPAVPTPPATPAPPTPQAEVAPAPATVVPEPVEVSERAAEPAPPAAEQTPPAEQTAVADASVAAHVSVGLSHYADAWQAILKELKQRGSIRIWGILNPSRPVDYDGRTLSVEVQHDFAVEQMNNPDNKGLVSQAIQAALGVSPSLRFVERGRAADPVEVSTAEEDVHDAQPVDAKEHDPLEALKRGFNAEVVEERGATT